MHAYQDTAFLQPWFLKLLLDTSVTETKGTNGTRYEATKDDAPWRACRNEERHVPRSRSRQRYNEGYRAPAPRLKEASRSPSGRCGRRGDSRASRNRRPTVTL